MTKQDTFQPELTIAIDIGTYSSGWALQWFADYERDKSKITTAKQSSLQWHKVPTCILLKVGGEQMS